MREGRGVRCRKTIEIDKRKEGNKGRRREERKRGDRKERSIDRRGMEGAEEVDKGNKGIKQRGEQ